MRLPAPAWRGAWERYWFVEDAPRNLAMARIIAAAIALWILCSRDFAAVSGLPSVFWEEVPDSTRWRFLIFPGHVRIETALLWTARLSAGAAMVGVAPRAASFTTALLLYHLAPLDGIVWTTSPYGRGLTLPLLALLLCAATPSGHALAIWPASRPARRGWEYGWPLRLLQLFLAQVYFFSGYAKLRASGLAWAAPSNLRNWMLLAAQNEEVAVHQALGSWLASREALAGVVGAGTLVFELGFAFALVRSRARPLIAASAIAFHAGILFAMNITFNSWPLLLVFFDWDGLAHRFRRFGRVS